MYYRHNLKYDYPEKCDEHMITVKHLRDTHFDENYEYLEKGFWRAIKKAAFWLLAGSIGFLLCKIRHGVKVVGKEKIRKNKELFKNGAITIANHVFTWDFLGVSMAIFPRLTVFPAWKTNFEGLNAGLIRWAGGMPIPTDSVLAMKKFNKGLKEVLESKRWLHFFPEGSMWWYYPDMRPFKKTVFRLSVQYNRPIIPLSYSFRPRKGLAKLFGKNPLATLTIGDPILPDTTLPKHEAVEKIHKEAYHIMQVLAGITPDMENYRTNQNLDEYVKTM
ncbi:MAG: 1-acyl-sn-glycerol-3-phosphate acyltransferase [Clostridia bacterium]|nr:1-acyl-sn-glycerol-3-phosphate acyltransferase [Clostridia bacterium]